MVEGTAGRPLPQQHCPLLQELRERVLRGKYRVPFYMSTDCESILRRFLVLNPAKRCTLEVSPGLIPPRLSFPTSPERYLHPPPAFLCLLPGAGCWWQGGLGTLPTPQQPHPLPARQSLADEWDSRRQKRRVGWLRASASSQEASMWGCKAFGCQAQCRTPGRWGTLYF